MTGWTRVSRWRLAIGSVLILGLAHGAAAQPVHEVPPVRLQASAILPADLIKGPNHQVAEEVLDDGYLNHYRIGSQFGEFTAVSTAALRIRIVELSAIAAMGQIETTSEFATSFEASGKRDIQGIENLVTQPVETLQGAVSGISRLFDRANESLFNSTRSQAEGSRWQDVVGYAKAKREVDHLLWTEAVARVTEAFSRRARELGLSEKHLWLTGTVSALAREQLAREGWVLHEQSETHLWARR